MKPVRIKYYGLFWISKRAYLLATLAAFLFAVAAFGFVWVTAASWRGPFTWPPPFRWPWEPIAPDLPPGTASWFYHFFWPFLLVMLLAEAIDIAVMLHKFARLEAEQEVEAALAPDEDDR